MLEMLWIASSSFLAALSGAIVPGPVFALVLSESLKNGKVAGPMIVLGHFLIEAIIISMIFMGLQQILHSELTKMIISYVGGVMLALMGLMLIREALRVSVNSILNAGAPAKCGKTPLYRMVLLGFLASCSNPHIFLWWLTIGLPVMVGSISIAGPLGLILFLIGHASADLSWFSFVSYSAHKGRGVLNEKAFKAILLASSIFLLSFAVLIIISAAVPQ